MEITEKTKIQYTIEVEDEGVFFIMLKLEEIEGSTPNFYQQLREALGVKKDRTMIIKKREIVDWED